MNDRLLRACRREPVDCTPIWLMRQAGRYLPEYRQIRERHAFLEMVRTPELAVEVTLQPLRRFALDAAIIFADILPVLIGMGVALEYAAGEGPVIHNPPRSRAEIEALRVPEPDENVPFTLAAIRLARQELDGKVPLIGFSGAPFTLASYLLEGGASSDYGRTKALMYTEPETWHLLMERLAQVAGDYLAAQVRAGAQVVQLFDSWAGALSPADYREFVLALLAPGSGHGPGRRRAGDPLQHRHGRHAGVDAGKRKRRDRHRLAHRTGDGMGTPRRRRRHPGKPGPGLAARAPARRSCAAPAKS